MRMTSSTVGKKFFFEFLGVCFLGVSQPAHHFDDKISGCDFSFFFCVSGGPAALLGKKLFFEFLGVCFLGVSQTVHHFGDKTAGCDFSFFWCIRRTSSTVGKFFFQIFVSMFSRCFTNCTSLCG